MRGRVKKRMRDAMRRAGLPEEALTGAARLTMIGKNRLHIENHCGLMELSPTRIRLRTREGTVCIQGQDLQLRELTRNAAEIEGEILETRQ